MKLYLISQNESKGYDTFSEVIVCANSEEEAKTIHPYGDIYSDDINSYDAYNRLNDIYAPSRQKLYNSWQSSGGCWATHPDRVNAEYIGEAAEHVKFGVVLASFHAG